MSYILSEYCSRWKLSVNRGKTKVVVLRKGGRLPDNLYFYYDGYQLEKVNKYTYLGIVFTSGGSFSEACSTLSSSHSRQYSNKEFICFVIPFPLIWPILFYGTEIWGFLKANQIERIHTLFRKRT